MVTTNTDNFGLRKQDKGDTDWHIPLNDNVDDLDDLLVITDTAANRSGYSPAAGQLFYATDEGRWSRYDGSDWQLESNALRTAQDDTLSDVNTLLSNADADETVIIDYPLTLPQNDELLLPSGTSLIVNATITRADSATGDNYSMVRNDDFTNGNSDIDIHFGPGGKLDQNAQNIDASISDNRFGFQFRGVDGLAIHNAQVVNNINFAANIFNCTDVSGSDFHVETDPAATDGNADGLHFIDVEDVVWHGVHGTTEDDLLAITVDDNTLVRNIHVDGVVGESTNANIVRINKAASTIGDGTDRTLRDISVTGINGRGAGANGVTLINADSDTFYENVRVEGVVRNCTGSGVVMGSSNGGHYEDCDIEVDVETCGSAGINAINCDDAVGCEIDATVRDSADGSSQIVVNEWSDCIIDATSVMETSSAGDRHIQMQGGAGNQIRGTYEGGGEGIFLGVTAATTDTTVNVTMRNVAGRGVEEDNASDRNLVYGSVFRNVSTPNSLAGSNSVFSSDNITS